MSEATDTHQPVRPPSTHHQALMVWIAVLPTLTLLQLALGHLVEAAPPYARPPIMATLAVPIVVYVLMPRLQQLGARLIKETQRC